MYLHEVAENEVSFTKEDMHQGKYDFINGCLGY